MGALAVAGTLALAGCGSDNSSTSSGASSGSGSSGSSGGGSGGAYASGTSSSSAPGGAGALALAADPSGKLAFDKKTLSAKAGKVTLKFANASGLPHAVEVEGNGTEVKTQVITKGSATLTTKLKPGRYEFYCPVDGHRKAGMEGTLTVK
jgi:plastocyanin